mmetsp:Transcript_3611/g.10270  ORF Transcript_3611/g.10270 Transcript_3611/m.10270 type:complete len:561 (+) Transcript_3611:120-1802(+)
MPFGGFFSGLIGRRRQEGEVGASASASAPADDDLERQSPADPTIIGYGSIDNNVHSDDDGDQENDEDELVGGGALLPGVEPPDRPGAPTPTEEHEDEQQQQSPPPTPPIVNPDDVESEEEAVQSLTQRLRCLFTVLTLPIIPIGTALSLLLLFVLYAAFVTDLHRQCSAPLHGFAITSLILFLYAPNHRAVKYHIFHYSRERDGPTRPRSVRVYDQAFQTLCILYVYFGMTLIQTCVDDTTTVPIDDGDSGNNSGADGSSVAGSAMASAVGLGAQPTAAMDSETAIATTMSTCEATCPALYASTKTFVATLQLFFLVLVMPLLMLPCIYVWVVRRASAVAALAELGRAGRDDFGGDDDDGGRRYTALEILNGMDSVRFIRAGGGPSGASDDGNGSEKVKIVTLAEGIPPGGDVEEGLGHSSGVTNAPPSRMPSYRDRDDVRECCICMAEFRLDGAELPEELAQLARNRDVMRAAEDPNSIVRTRCGHYFHRNCLGGWLGGQWTGDGNQNMESQRARRRACPLCREDLAPISSSSTRANSGLSDVDRVVEESTALLDPGLM